MKNLVWMVVGSTVVVALVLGFGGAWLIERVREAAHAEQRQTQLAGLQTFEARGLATVTLRANLADVRVHRDPGAAVRLAFVRLGVGQTEAEAKARAAAIRITGKRDGATLAIEGHVPADGGPGALPALLAGAGHRLVLDLYLPAGAPTPALDFDLEAGKIALFATSGAPAKLHVGAGEIEAAGVVGDLAATVGAGHIQLMGGRGRTKAAIDSGDIKLHGRTGPEAVLTAQTGDLEWVFDRALPAVSRLETQTGHVHLALAKDAGAALELEALTGQITDQAGLTGAIRPEGAGARASLRAGPGAAKLGARVGTGSILVEGPLGVQEPTPGEK